MNCIVCGHSLPDPSSSSWSRRCSACGYRFAALAIDVNREQKSYELDEEACFRSLEPLQRKNFTRILAALKAITPLAGKKLLDVGCATGLFLELARAEGMVVSGVEADAKIAAIAMKKFPQVRNAYFSADVFHGETFDVIVFNDVLEHILDIGATLATCRSLLSPGGLLVINIPNSNGILFRIANGLNRIGLTGPWKRLWQKDFPSPHLHYFNCANLSRLAAAGGFGELRRMRLGTFASKGAFRRVTSGGMTAANIFMAAALLVLNPLLKLLPADQTAQIFKSKINEERT